MSAPASDAIHPLEHALVVAQGESIETNVARWWYFAGAPAWVELQSLKIAGDRGGWEESRYAHVDGVQIAATLATQADKWNAPACYLIANTIDPSITSRGDVRAWITMRKGSSSTSDNEIASRSVLYIDVDAVRAPGISATDAEMAHAARLAVAVHAELAATLEDPSSLGYGHSGNGRAVLLALDRVDRSRGGQLHHALLIALGARFTDAHAKIDQSVHDAKRLIPLWGTMKKKGRKNVEDRPHRKTAFACANKIARVSVAELEQLVAMMREGLGDESQREIDRALGIKTTTTARSSGVVRHDDGADPFAAAKEVPIRDVLTALGLMADDAPVCCGCGLSDQGVAIVGNGLKCSHARCAAKGVRDGFRTTIDVVCEAKGCSAIDAVRFLGERFGFAVESNRSRTEQLPDEPPPDFFEDDRPAEPEQRITVVTPVFTGTDLAKEQPAPTYIAASLGLPDGAGAPHIFGGYGFSGKTITAQAMLLALAADRAIWKAFTGPGRALRVSHVDGEQGFRLTQRRYKRLAHAMGIDLAELGDLLRLFVFPKLSNGRRLLLVEENRALWKELMSDRDLFVIDSFAALRDGTIKENDPGVRRSLEMLGEISEETACRALVIHHAVKQRADERFGAEPDARQALRGSGGIYDVCDSIYLLTSKKGEAIKAEQIKARSHGEPVEDFALVIDDVARVDDPRWGLSVHVAGVELIEEQRATRTKEKETKTLERDVARIRTALATGARLNRTDLMAAARVSGGSFTRAWAVLKAKGEASVEAVKDGRTTSQIHFLKGRVP